MKDVMNLSNGDADMTLSHSLPRGVESLTKAVCPLPDLCLHKRTAAPTLNMAASGHSMDREFSLTHSDSTELIT